MAVNDGRGRMPVHFGTDAASGVIFEAGMQELGAVSECNGALKEAVDSIFRGVAEECRGDGTNVEAYVAEAFSAIDEALTQLGHACRVALVTLVQTQNAGLREEALVAAKILGSLEDIFLDAAEQAADHSERPIQRELLRHIVAARTGGTRVGAIASNARRDHADRFTQASGMGFR